MVNDLPAKALGTRDARSLANLTDHHDLGFEETPVGKKFSRRSLQDDAFSAEESVSRRSRVMGQEFANAHDDDIGADGISGVADRLCRRAELNDGCDVLDAEPPGLLRGVGDDLVARFLKDRTGLRIEALELGIRTDATLLYGHV